MAIITKPTIVKGTPATISLDKTELAAHPLVSSNSYFSNTDKWKKVEVIYISSPGNQSKDVEFDATVASPTGSIFFTLKARDLFQVEKILIIDFDNGVLQIPRASLNVVDFDISFNVEVYPTSVVSSNFGIVGSLINGNYSSDASNYAYSSGNISHFVVRKGAGAGNVTKIGIGVGGFGSSDSSGEWTPGRIVISGSNDNSVYIDLKTFNFNRADWVKDVQKVLELNSPASYEYFKITFDQHDKTTGGSLVITEIELMGV